MSMWIFVLSKNGYLESICKNAKYLQKYIVRAFNWNTSLFYIQQSFK